MLQLLELADAGSDLGPMPLDELEDQRAGWRAAVTDVHDLTDLGHTQPDRLRRANERHAGQRIAVIVTVARYCTRQPRQGAGLRVVAQGGRRHAAAAGQLPNLPV